MAMKTLCFIVLWRMVIILNLVLDSIYNNKKHYLCQVFIFSSKQNGFIYERIFSSPEKICSALQEVSDIVDIFYPLVCGAECFFIHGADTDIADSVQGYRAGGCGVHRVEFNEFG
jgi:hypothetical protein